MHLKFYTNIQEDIDVYIRELTEPDRQKRWPHIKEAIYNTFSELKKIEEGSVDTKEYVTDFLSGYADTHVSQIQDITEDMGSDIEQYGDKIVGALQTAMDHKIQLKEYKIRGALTVSSLFGTNIAIISMVKKIQDPDFRIPVRSILAHELSHTIFDVLYKDLGEDDILMFDFLKESFAPVILSLPIFDDIIENSALRARANPQQDMIQFDYKGQTFNSVKILKDLYIEMKDKGATFSDIIQRSIEIFTPVSDQIKQKMDLQATIPSPNWMDDDEMKTYKDALKKLGYFEPIEL